MNLDPPGPDRLRALVAELQRRLAERAADTDSARVALAEADADLAATERLLAGAVLVVARHHIVRVNPAACELLDYHERDLVGRPIAVVWPHFQVPPWASRPTRGRADWRRADGELVPVAVTCARGRASSDRVVCSAVDQRALPGHDLERDHDHKLEALGQLAASVAHEVNTPMQFISDNLHLLRQGFDGARLLVDRLRVVRDAAREAGIVPALVDDADQAEAASGWDYLAPRMERAFARADDGVARVTEIVRALGLFSHPENQLAAVDVNRALETTLTVAGPVLRDVATVVTELGELPPVIARAGDLNQAFLNLLINSAHAIAEVERDGRGTITVRTRAVGDRVVVEIADDGCGIPAAIGPRVFDPFFTTKPPGQGTGQGLALVHAVVVDGHGGAIRFDSQPSRGTTFYVELPVAGPRVDTVTVRELAP